MRYYTKEGINNEADPMFEQGQEIDFKVVFGYRNAPRDEHAKVAEVFLATDHTVKGYKIEAYFGDFIVLADEFKQNGCDDLFSQIHDNPQHPFNS